MELNEEQKLLLDHIEQASRMLATSIAEMELDEAIVRDPSIAPQRESRLKILTEQRYQELFEGFKTLFFDFSQVESLLKPSFDQLSSEKKEAILSDFKKIGQISDRFLNWPQDKAFTFQTCAGISAETMAWFYSVALDYTNRGEIDKGMTLFRYLTFLNPLIPDCWTSLGYCQMQKGNSEDAISSFKNAIELDPLALQARIYQVQTYFQQKQSDEARRATMELEQVLKDNPKQKDFLPYLRDLKGRI